MATSRKVAIVMAVKDTLDQTKIWLELPENSDDLTGDALRFYTEYMDFRREMINKYL